MLHFFAVRPYDTVYMLSVCLSITLSVHTDAQTIHRPTICVHIIPVLSHVRKIFMEHSYLVFYRMQYDQPVEISCIRTCFRYSVARFLCNSVMSSGEPGNATRDVNKDKSQNPRPRPRTWTLLPRPRPRT